MYRSFTGGNPVKFKPKKWSSLLEKVKIAKFVNLNCLHVFLWDLKV